MTTYKQETPLIPHLAAKGILAENKEMFARTNDRALHGGWQKWISHSLL